MPDNRITAADLQLVLHSIDGEHARAVLREALCQARLESDPVARLGRALRALVLDPQLVLEGAEAKRVQDAARELAIEFDAAGRRVK